MKVTLFVLLLLLVYWTGVSAVLTVTIDVDYTPPPDFVGGPNDYRAASKVTLTCQVIRGVGWTFQWSSTCTGPSSDCFVPGQTTQAITRGNLRSTDSGNHTCTATRDIGNTGSATIEMNVVGAGIYVNIGDRSAPTGVLPNNGIVIARDVTSGTVIQVQCRSGSTMTGVGQLVDLDGNTFNIGQTSGVFNIEQPKGGLGFVQFRRAETLTAADEGVYSCRIPDETGSDVDVNIGVYQNGFNTPPTVSSLTYDCGTRTLTCTSTDSPATTVTWTKDSDTLTIDGKIYSMTQTLMDRRTSTYENALTLPATGDISGTYSCLVGNALGNSTTVTADVTAPLQVAITTSGDTVAGEQYTLTCTVTVPESSGLSGTPTVEWTGDEGKTSVTEGKPDTSGRVTTLTLTFNLLQDSQDGVYTCTAAFDLTDPTICGAAAWTLEVMAPEVTVTVSATGAPIVGGTNYSLTCDHDAPQSLNATVQSTLTTGGTMLTSLPRTFNPLLVTDGGQYSCTATVSSPYLTGDFTATQGTPLDVVVEIPSPGVEASANPTGSVFAGSVLTLTCTITLDGGLSGIRNDLSVTTVWRTEGGQEVSTGGNFMVSGATFAVGTTYSSTLSFNTVHTDDAGAYICTATVSPSSSPSVPANTVINGVGSSDPPVTVFVNAPLITVSLEPNTTRLPTEPPYNTFTITCTAIAPEGVLAWKTIEWKRRIGTSGGFTTITNSNNGIQITTGLNQPETTSVLTVTETTPGDYRYRCQVDIPEIGSVSRRTKDVYPIGVIAPAPPATAENLMVIALASTSATVSWTVPMIAFTPETYSVKYGTERDNLESSSSPVQSGTDFSAVNLPFSVTVTGLTPQTVYHYQLVTSNSIGNDASVVQPLTPDIMIQTSGISTAGENYELICTSNIPVALSGDLTVGWSPIEGGVSQQVSAHSSTLMFNPLQSSHERDYTCSATLSLTSATPVTVVKQISVDVMDPDVLLRIVGSASEPTAGENYTVTCTVMPPENLMATIEKIEWKDSTNTLLVASVHEEVSLDLSFTPLELSNSGNYTCSATVRSPYLDHELRLHSTTYLNVQIPSPDVQVTHDGNTILYAGSRLTLTCNVTLPNILSGYNVGVNTTWNGVRDGEHTTVTDATLVTNIIYSSMVVFSLLHTRDTGNYTCRANITPPRGFGSTGISTEESHTLAIIIEIPTIIVSVESNTTRLPTEPPYNTFTITCTATAPEGVVAGKTFEWKRRIGSSISGLSEITDNTTIQIMTTGPNQPETTSVLTVTETTPGDYRYRCIVNITELGSGVRRTKDMYPIDVIGPTPPEKPTNLMDIVTSFDSATIQWTVPLIAFTPETYVVHYGTNMGSLDLMSGPVESGDDFVAENMSIFTIHLTELHPGTMYYYQVSATNSNASILSDIELFQTNDKPPSAPPQHFMIKTVSDEPTMLHFSWDPPPENKQNGNITNYRLLCNPDPFGGVPKVFHQSSNIDVTLDGFVPATTYQCRVSAGTSAGYGPDGTMPIMTLENTPGSPPQNVRLLAESPSTVLVTWVEPDMPNGVIILYTVYVNGSMDGTTEGTVTMYTITDLLPYQLVTVSVSAHTAVGEGPESNATSVRSMEAAPGKVSNLVAVGRDSMTLYVSWDKPVALNGVLKNYIIFVNQMDSGENISVKEVDVNTQNITIHQFGPGIPYNVSVAAVNSAGRGELESVIVFTEEKTPSIPPKVEAMRLNNTNMNVSWELLTLIQGRGHITNYTVSYQPTGTVELETETVVPGDQNSVVIGGLDPYEAYSVQVWANTSAGRGNTSETLTIEAVLSQQETDHEDGAGAGVGAGAGAGAAAGGAVGAILALIILIACCIVAVVVVRWLRQHGKLQFSDRPRSKSTTVTKQQEMAPDISSEGDVELTAIGKENSANVDNDDYFEDTCLMVGERTRPIPVSLFGAHVERMSQDRNKGLELEYRSLGKQPQSSYDVSEIPHNKVRNRFINIFPYDFSRVKLKEIEGVEGSDYINASFLDGYRKKRAYIGAQGPLSNSLTDFVRMIWEQRLPTVVMVTRCFESARKKCEQYWPENIDETLTPGLNLSVTLTSVLPYAEYEVRKFTVKDDSDPEQPPLQVTHFYYLGWPDHGVPTNAMSVINFIKQVRKVHPPSHNRPLLVHCSAGVGRTGTFIVIDSMIQRMKEEDSLNIFEFLKKLRSQRVLMVQTETQYVFIHDALNELITCGETEILAGNLRIITNQLNRYAEGKKISGFQNQYEILEQVSCKVKDGDYTEAMASYNFHKNRYTYKLACESARVVLRSTAAHGSDYINASFINGYRQCGAYIATQGPLKSTVNDFWRMMWEYQSKCIVQLCSLQEKGAEACYPYWPMVLGESVTFGKLTVTLQSESTNSDHVVRKLVVSEKKAMPVDGDSFTVTQFQYTEWAEEGEPKPTTSSLLELVKSVTKIQMGTRNKPITVICNDGMGRTGTFICIHAQLECLKTEGMVDIFQYIKSARINRAGMVQNLEQYILCHDAVSDYVDTFDTYANFKELV